MNHLYKTLRDCPQCSSTLHACNFVEDCLEGTRFWSDGKLDTYALPGWLAYARCPLCQEPLKINGWPKSNAPNAAFRRAPSVEWPDAAGFRQLIERALAANDREEEKLVRIAYWLHLNDALRSGHLRLRPVIDDAWQLALDQNLARLAHLLDETVPDERLRKGEVLRERGFFDEALKMLRDLPPKLQWNADQIAIHAASGNEALFGLENSSGVWMPIPPASGNTRGIADVTRLG